MKISFQKHTVAALPQLLFCWRLEIKVERETAVADIFIPELFYDYLFVQKGAIGCTNPVQGTAFTLPAESLKTLHTQRLDFRLKAPLILYGARLTLPFAELFWQETCPANTFLRQSWLQTPVTSLAQFARQITETIQTRRGQKTAAPMLHPTLEETDWLAAYSPRHKRRLYRSIFDLSRKEIEAIQNVHLFLGQPCAFAAQMPRIVEYVNEDSFYDQPHLNNAFKKITGLAPLAYFEATSILQDNLMAASYNELPNNSAKIPL